MIESINDNSYDLTKYLYSLILGLKTLKRKGWQLRGIKNPESVAEHSLAVSLLSMHLSKKFGVDENRCVKLSLVHDLAESIVGDITPNDSNVSEKKTLEKNAICKIAKQVPDFKELLEEYESNKTREARFVHDIDKIEMVLQAIDYQKKDPKKDLSEFFDYTKDKLILEESRKLFSEIMKKSLVTNNLQ
jgi:putative hydrolases of HD superfamily